MNVRATVDGCEGPPTSFTVTVNPTPKVNTIANATYCNNESTAINFTSPTTGGTVSYHWTSTQDVGFDVVGNTNIGSFIASNPGNDPVTTTVSVTATVNGCTGLPMTFTVTVNPNPIVNNVSNATYCQDATRSSDQLQLTDNGGCDHLQLDELC